MYNSYSNFSSQISNFFVDVPTPQALDSFSELVSSSIEYGESSAHQVQPNKVVTLNVPLLERILVNTKEIIDQQAYKAAAGKAK